MNILSSLIKGINNKKQTFNFEDVQTSVCAKVCFNWRSHLLRIRTKKKRYSTLWYSHLIPLSHTHNHTHTHTHSHAEYDIYRVWQLAAHSDTQQVGSFPALRWAQTGGYGYAPNPDQPHAFMAVAMDLPDFTSPDGPWVTPVDSIMFQWLLWSYTSTVINQQG